MDILVKDTSNNEEEISKNFYADFKAARLKLFEHICMHNHSPLPDARSWKKLLLEKTQKLSDFMRVTKLEGKRHPQSLETAIVHFEDNEKKVTVDLVAAVHIGDKEYYEELNKRFKKYDAVLYELVAENGMVPMKKSEVDPAKQNLLSAFQSTMGQTLKLDFQLEHIDYSAKNFVHADLSPAEFARRVDERGDVFQTLYRAIVLGLGKDETEEMRMQGRFLGTFLARDKSLQLKRFFAQEMVAQMEDSVFVIGGDGSAIISDRNAAALKVLRQEIRLGKKKLAIFYGGAHLPEFVKSLEHDFNMKQTGISWVVAWDLTVDRSGRKIGSPRH